MARSFFPSFWTLFDQPDVIKTLAEIKHGIADTNGKDGGAWDKLHDVSIKQYEMRLEAMRNGEAEDRFVGGMKHALEDVLKHAAGSKNFDAIAKKAYAEFDADIKHGLEFLHSERSQEAMKIDLVTRLDAVEHGRQSGSEDNGYQAAAVADGHPEAMVQHSGVVHQATAMFDTARSCCN